MMDATTIPANTVSFRDFLFKDKRNRTILILAAVAVVIQWAVFKYFYPFANFIHGDSFSYIKAAYQNLNINTYLIGYSKFLRLFNVFSTSDYALTAFQYILLQSSALLLLFTIFYFYNPGKIARIILLCFIVLNPLLLHLANLISSDGFFLSISMVWFALLIWLIHKPSKAIIFWHAIALFIAFTIRYNAMIYPLISLIAFYLSKISMRQKLTGYGAAIALCALFVVFTSNQYKKLTGTWQYAPFSGWQLANNAMYTYRYVKNNDRISVPNNIQRLDSTIRAYFDTTHKTGRYFIVERMQASSYYMWSPGLPLIKFQNEEFNNKRPASDLKKWAMMAPLYKSYGTYIIKHYPLHYAQYFLWPNAKKYFALPLEFMGSYNSGEDTVTPVTQTWFNYKSNKVTTKTSDTTIYSLTFYPILSGLINFVLICGIAFFIVLKAGSANPFFAKGLVLISIFWLLNAAFTISASPAALRFQAFSVILNVMISVLLIDIMCQMMTAIKNNELKSSNETNISKINLNSNVTA